jgi:hypothetical protein
MTTDTTPSLSASGGCDTIPQGQTLHRHARESRHHVRAVDRSVRVKAARFADRSAGPARLACGTSGTDPPDARRSA